MACPFSKISIVGSTLEPMICLEIGAFVLFLLTQVQASSYGMRLKSNQKVVQT